jgi:hypothetical protein
MTSGATNSAMTAIVIQNIQPCFPNFSIISIPHELPRRCSARSRGHRQSCRCPVTRIGFLRDTRTPVLHSSSRRRRSLFRGSERRNRSPNWSGFRARGPRRQKRATCAPRPTGAGQPKPERGCAAASRYA